MLLDQYECYLPTSVCSKKFHNVKGRRLHLTDAHGFPSSYFFAVVKEGVSSDSILWSLS